MPFKIFHFAIKRDVIGKNRLYTFSESAPSNYVKSTFVWNSAKLMQTSVVTCRYVELISDEVRNEN